MNHHGYIYQSCNFLYTGCTRERIDRSTEDGRHARHCNKDNSTTRKYRSPKHRYIYFCSTNKTERKKMMRALKFNIEDYPKGNNSNYVLGEYLKERYL